MKFLTTLNVLINSSYIVCNPTLYKNNIETSYYNNYKYETLFWNMYNEAHRFYINLEKLKNEQKSRHERVQIFNNLINSVRNFRDKLTDLESLIKDFKKETIRQRHELIDFIDYPSDLLWDTSDLVGDLEDWQHALNHNLDYEPEFDGNPITSDLLLLKIREIQQIFIILDNLTKRSNNNEKSIQEWKIPFLEPHTYEYYYSILNKSGDDLINKLNYLISSTYTAPKIYESQNYKSLWNLFSGPGFEDYKKPGKIIDIYSKNPSGQDLFNFDKSHQNQGQSPKKFGETYNREHIIPKSHFKKQEPMVYDAHHIFPADTWVNGKRGDYIHDDVVQQFNIKFPNKAKFGLNINKLKAYEPDDSFKGDIARSYLYFSIRYRENISNFTNNTVFQSQFPYFKDENYLSRLLTWHEKIDWVGKFDYNRNNAIFLHQENRNPFIDLPNLSKFIWDKNFKDQEFRFKKLY